MLVCLVHVPPLSLNSHAIFVILIFSPILTTLALLPSILISGLSSSCFSTFFGVRVSGQYTGYMFDFIFSYFALFLTFVPFSIHFHKHAVAIYSQVTFSASYYRLTSFHILINKDCPIVPRALFSFLRVH